LAVIPTLHSTTTYTQTTTSQIYTLSLHDALPISEGSLFLYAAGFDLARPLAGGRTRHFDELLEALQEFIEMPGTPTGKWSGEIRSEEHTSELQSRGHLVCRLLLEKKNNKKNISIL